MPSTQLETSQSDRSRILSIDALRGFDMFWIIGGDSLAVAILTTSGWSAAAQLAEQFEHVDWQGFRFYDLIFPLFLFLVGCVLPFSLDKYRDQPKAAYWRIVRRATLLVVLGLIGNNILQFDWGNLRIAGVLQRIGICYALAAILYLHARVRGQALAIAAILLGYWALLALFPVPGGSAGDYSKEGNLAGYVDRNFLPGKILKPYYGFGDNEGILSTIPAIATTLIGALAGQLLKSSLNAWSKAGWLALSGLACIAVGQAWGLTFPIVKNIWTSSFVLVAGGWSLLLLSLFYTILDVLKWRGWELFWVVIGMNAITIYVAQRFIDFSGMSKFFLAGIAGLCGDSSRTILLAGAIAAKWLFLYFLYRQKVFLRV